MLLARKVQSLISPFRGIAVLLVWLIFIATGCLITTVIGLQQHHDQTMQAGRLALTRIEQLLTDAQRTSMQIASLVGQPCKAVLPTLRTTATQAAFIHSLKLVQQNRVYCASIMADLNDPLPTNHNNTVTPLTLLPGSTSHPHHPMLSLWTPTPRGSVISNIDSTHLTNLLSLNLPAGQVWLLVGELWLDSTGTVHSTPPHQARSVPITHNSVTYPLSISLYYATDFTTWIGWAQQWHLTWLLWLVLSLSASIALWGWLSLAPSLENALVHGLTHREFIPYVQPLFTARPQQLCGLEVLMRWRHPKLGLVEPMQFIPQAEASGLIVPMTSQLMAEVAKQLVPLLTQLPSPFHVAINISAAHFTSTTLLNDCREFLARFPTNQVVLSLELTERELLCNTPQTKAMLEELWLLGVQLALDDFGTGHSSLAYLNQFPVNIIKLDQMFVSKIGVEKISQHVVDHVVELGHKLGLQIIAEGVEAAHQAEYLTQKRVNQLQGYLFGKPQPLHEWLTTLDTKIGVRPKELLPD
ncbi:EAL domain-containing protein [Aeromonas dhakensis]|uniref:EAL domain-containing protein n=1 Tax=Aeromonas dhakensis TaxID=196024 RepID=UPI00280E5F94|nr:EAL domain-containing protein [Aeromonas hydrophila]